jgi:hypothetical protein
MILVLLVVGTIVCWVISRGIWQHRIAARIKIISANGIDSLEKIKLGGVGQWMLVRGWNRDNPVLLLMHGGPGFPCMPFAHVAAELEKQFVVVHWDQRGAGKSYSPSIPANSMNMKQFVADTLDLLLRLTQDGCALFSITGAANAAWPEVKEVESTIGRSRDAGDSSYCAHSSKAAESPRRVASASPAKCSEPVIRMGCGLPRA